MPTLSLFPFEDNRLVPAADRAEPVFWIRRLVIVPSFQADAVPFETSSSVADSISCKRVRDWKPILTSLATALARHCSQG